MRSRFSAGVGRIVSRSIGLATRRCLAGGSTSILATEQQVNQDQATLIKARFMEAVRGKREPTVLGAGVKYHQIQVSPEEAMFLDALKFAGLEIGTMVFHIPPAMLALAVEGSSLTYSNREQDEILFQTRALLTWAGRFEQHISRLLPGKQYIKFNFDAGVRVDLTTRYKAHEIGIRSRFLHPDEARELEDRPPLTPAQKEDLKPAMPATPSPPKEDPDD